MLIIRWEGSFQERELTHINSSPLDKMTAILADDDIFNLFSWYENVLISIENSPKFVP